MNLPLIWHPKFNVYPYQGQGLLLLSETTSLWLATAAFPCIAHVNGERTPGQINQLLGQQGGPLCFYQLNQLVENGLLLPHDPTDSQTRLPNYQSHSTPAVELLWQHKADKIVCLSTLPAPWLTDWCQMVSGLISAVDQGITVLLVDDFLDPKINHQLNPEGRYWLLKVSGENLWVGPLLSANAGRSINHQWQQLQQRLWENQPLRTLAATLFPEQPQRLPFQCDQPLNAKHWQQLQRILTQQLLGQPPLIRQDDDQDLAKQYIALFNVENERLDHHPINDYFDSQYSFSEQLHQPVTLQPCRSVFDHDGGSRSVTPAQTLAKLRPLISPVTGVINHLSVHLGSADKVVKIYRTGFFKTPAIHGGKTIDNDLFVQTCLGKGVGHQQSMVSGLCEAIERYNAHYRGDEPLLLAKASTLTQAYRSYSVLVPYSELQYQQFADPNHPASQRKQAVSRYDDSEIPWTATWSLTEQTQVLVPFSCCFSNIPFAAEQFGLWHSNGCAAGNTLEEAILQALFELIERDATAIWWYNRVQVPGFDLRRIAADNLAKLAQTLDQTHRYWVLDITTDIGIPAMVAMGQDRRSGGYIMGLGCHLLPELAAQRALTELCQLIPIRNQNAAPFDFDAMVEGDYLHPRQPSDPLTDDPGMIPETAHIRLSVSDAKDIKQIIETIVERLQTLGLDTLVLNYSRAHLPIKTAKVFVPGLAHIWPQLANERLYSVPVKMGWQSQQLTEAELNSQPLYI